MGYIISQRGAEKLLPITQKPSVTADDWRYFERYIDLKILHCRPIFVVEGLRLFDSTIRIEKDDFLKPKLSSVIRRSLTGYLKNITMNYLGLR